mgnify:CR=1 FL=1
MGLIKTRDAVSGMIINKDVYLENSRVIVMTSGTILNHKKLKRLRAFGIQEISILEEEISKDDENNNVQIERDSFFKNYDILEKEVSTILNNAKIGKKIIIKDVSNIMDDVIKDVIKNNNILGKLRQIEGDNDYTLSHSIEVSLLATMIGKWMNYSKKELKQLALAGLFHDIGKFKIPSHILNKPGKLTKAEFDIMKKHTIFGYNILDQTLGLSKNIAYAALQHHERVNGSGYPLGLKSKNIHEFSKIIAVCDVFNAMTNDRVYKSKDSPFRVAEKILTDSFDTLDPKICTVFLNNISKFYTGNIVRLNTGDIAEIVYVHKEISTRPIVKLEDEFIDLLNNKEYEILEIID